MNTIKQKSLTSSKLQKYYINKDHATLESRDQALTRPNITNAIKYEC